MSPKFNDLPLEILPVILQCLVKTQHIATACLVNRAFSEFTAPLLYRRVYIYSWQTDGKTRVIQLFHTLARYPRLAQYVQRLEIRDFPKAFTQASADSTDSTLKIVCQGLRNCINLEACTWTRDGSLNSDILDALADCTHLSNLEINGQHHGNYDPKTLCKFTRLEKLALIMGKAAVVDVLPSWMALTGSTLRHLTILCKASPIITDAILASVAPSLVHLDALHLAGLPKVTYLGIWSMISTNIGGIKALGLEGLSPRFGLVELSNLCSRHNSLRRLEAITLTVDQQTLLDGWMNSVVDLLGAAPLKTFQVYSSGAVFEASVTDKFWSCIVRDHGDRLTRFSVHRMLMSIGALGIVCRGCSQLEELFIVAERNSLSTTTDSLAIARKLRVIHLNFPLEAQTDVSPAFSVEDACSIVASCSTTVTQFGCNTRVWKVDRIVFVSLDSVKTTKPSLVPYENPEIPEPFLVVRA